MPAGWSANAQLANPKVLKRSKNVWISTECSVFKVSNRLRLTGWLPTAIPAASALFSRADKATRAAASTAAHLTNSSGRHEFHAYPVNLSERRCKRIWISTECWLYRAWIRLHSMTAWQVAAVAATFARFNRADKATRVAASAAAISMKSTGRKSITR